MKTTEQTQEQLEKKWEMERISSNLFETAKDLERMIHDRKMEIDRMEGMLDSIYQQITEIDKKAAEL